MVINCAYPKNRVGTNFEKMKINEVKDDLFNQLGALFCLAK